MKYWLRNTLYLTVMTLMAPWLVYRSMKTGRYRRGFRQQLLGLREHDLLQSPDVENFLPACNEPLGQCLLLQTIWLHGVSVGEVQLLAPLLNRLQAEHPRSRFVFSATTDSGMELAERLLPTVKRFYFPFDFSWAVSNTLQAVQPSMIILGELELWPNLIDRASKRNIPLIVVNGRLSERSFRGYSRLNGIVGGMFAKITHVAAQSETYAARFRDCGCAPEHVTVTGSMKFDNVGFDRDAPQVTQLRKLVGLTPGQRVLVVGSTQSPEEQAACDSFVSLRDRYPELKLIVVPRHPDRFDEVARVLAERPVRVLRRSEITTPCQSDDWDVLMVDTVGELRWWWGLSEIAVVGGSFGERGGQNMIEPAAYGANVAFGPNTKNFNDITEMLLLGDAATRLLDLNSLTPWLDHQLSEPQAGRQRGQNARDIVASQQGAIDRTVDVIRANLPSPSQPSAKSAA